MPISSASRKSGVVWPRLSSMVYASKILLVIIVFVYWQALNCLIDSYIKARDPSNFAEVIEIASRAGKHDDLVRYLQMARKTLREPKVDTELAYAYAKTDRLHDMEEFLSMTNVADVLEVGEKCFNDQLYQAAKLLFSSISNWAKLATTLIYLGENQAAVESARKAGNTQYVLVYGNNWVIK